jgi:hypothetical protein
LSDIRSPKTGVGGVCGFFPTDFHQDGKAGGSFLRSERWRWAKGLDRTVNGLKFIEEFDGLDPILRGSHGRHLGKDPKHLFNGEGPFRSDRGQSMVLGGFL